MSIFLFAKTLEGLGVAADIGVPSAVPLATPIAPVSVVPSVLVSVLPTAPIITGPSKFPFPLSPFPFFFPVSLSLLDHGLSSSRSSSLSVLCWIASVGVE